MRSVAAMVVLVGTLVGVILAPDPGRTLRSSVALHDFGHVPAFALVAVCLLVLLPRRRGASGSRVARRGLGVVAATTLLGVLVELVQGLFPGAKPSPADVLADAGGACIAALVSASIVPGTTIMRRAALRAVAVIVVAVFFSPVALALLDEARARRAFPVLADFTSASQLSRFDDTAWSRISLAKNPRPTGELAPALRLHLGPGVYPGMSLDYFPRDWRGWRALALEIVNPASDSLALHLRIDDLRHDESYEDRFNDVLQLPPGRTVIEIPLASVESAPRGRKLDLGAVRSVELFALNLRAPRELLVEDIRLLR